MPMGGNPQLHDSPQFYKEYEKKYFEIPVTPPGVAAPGLSIAF